MKPFNVAIVNADTILYEGTAVSLVVPAGLGSMGILADHVPIISTLGKGSVTLLKNFSDPAQVFSTNGSGFVEVSRESVTVLLDCAKG